MSRQSGLRLLLAHPQSLRSRRARAAVLVVALAVIGAVLIGEVATPKNVTFGGFTLLAIIGATWLLPMALYLPVMAAALANPPISAALGGVDPLTAKFQFSANLAACVLAYFTVRALKATEVERQRSHENLMRFTADAAHELRSPLTLIRANLDHLLRQRRSPEEYEVRTRTVLRELDRLIGVSNTLLALAQSDAGLLALEAEPVELADLGAELTTRWQEAAAIAGVQLAYDCPEDALVRCDPGMIGRVLDNLVENALRHTPAGGSVRITVSPGPGEWRIAVADTGTGIPEGFQGHVFDRFSRADQKRSPTGGAGLGLPLSAAIARAHRGSLNLVSSSSTTGTTMVLNLPVTGGSA